MAYSRMDFRGRLSVGAVCAGLLVSYALALLSVTLAGSLGFWEFRLFGLPRLFSGFWICSTLGWAVACYCGGFVAAFGAGSSSARDGLLHGFVTWSAACAVAYGIVFFALRLAFVSELSESTPAGLFSVFVGNLLGLVFSLAGGLHGALYERRLGMAGNRHNEPKLAA